MASNRNNLLSMVGSKVSRSAVATVAIYLSAVGDGESISHGAPIVFKFDATISQIQGDAAALNLPFSLTVGQQVTGRFTFQNAEDLLDIFTHHERGKEGVVALSIDGTLLEALLNLGSLNDGVPVEITGTPPGPNSSLTLGYVSPTDAIPGWGGRSGLNEFWGAGLVLIGPEGTIAAPEDILNIANWNELTTLRRIGLQIGFPDTVLIQATVGDFVGVPEPPTIWLVWAMIAAATVPRPTRTRPQGIAGIA